MQQSSSDPVVKECTRRSDSSQSESRLPLVSAASLSAVRPPASHPSAQVEANKRRDADTTDGDTSQRSRCSLEWVRPCFAGPVIAETWESTGYPSNKDGVKAKGGSGWTACDAAAPAVSRNNLQDESQSATEAGAARQFGQGPPSPGRADNLFCESAPVPASVAQGALRVELTNGTSTGTSAELAFALRLKPLTPAAMALLSGSASLPTAHELGAKAGAISDGASTRPTPIHAGGESGTGPGSGGEDSRRGNPGSSRSASAPDRSEKTAQADKEDAPLLTENAAVDWQGERACATSVVQPSTSPASTEGRAVAQPASQPAPAVVANSREAEDPLAIPRSAREISLQVSSGGDHKVEVRLVQRDGEVHVSVRTPDTALAHEMRQDLGSLTGKLAQSGYATEHFTPTNNRTSSFSDQRSDTENQNSSHGRDQDPPHGGSGQQRQAQDERGKRPAWIDEMEDRLAQRQNDRSTAWLLNR